jgi:tetratricopeptide (TPR) repeat protein
LVSSVDPVPGSEADEARDLRAVALLLIQHGRPEEAIAKLEAAIEASRSAGDVAGEGEGEFLLAWTYRKISSTGEEHARLVRLHASRAEATSRRAGDRAGLIDALSLLAIHFNERGDDANLRYTLAQLQLVDPGTASWLEGYTAAVASMFVERDRAVGLFRQALGSLDPHARNSNEWRDECLRKLAFLGAAPEPTLGEASGEKAAGWPALFQEALRLARRGEGDDAVERRLDDAIGAAEDLRRRIRSEVKQRELSEAMAPLYTAKVTLADRAGRYEDALDTLELNTSRSLLSRGALRGLWARSPTQSFEELRETNDQIRDCLVRYRRTPGVGEWEQLQRALRRRRETSHRVQEQLVRLVEAPHEVFSTSRSSGLQDSMRADDAVVVFAPGGSVYAVRPSGVSKVTTFDDGVYEACQRYRTLAGTPGRSAPDRELEQVGRAIAEACLEPLAPVLDDATRVLIVPCGRLWAVPLDALGREVLGTRSVGIVPSLSAAHRLLKRSRPARRVERFVGVGNPDRSLPGAAEEVETVARRFDDHAVLTGDDVDFLTVLQLAFDADVIHLACHGISFRDYPELSFLDIGPQGPPSPWFVEDVIRVPMSPRLVVLSACHAGTSMALPGNEYVGFPGAFLVADTQTVVAPLWAIPDSSTLILMEAFYAEMGRRSPSEALRAAQDVLRADPATAHPFHWSGVEVFGLP